MTVARYITRTVFLVSLAVGYTACDGGGNSSAASNRAAIGLVSGALVDIPESRGNWTWGDNINGLCQQWSAARFEVSGWFYGSSFSWSSADVYVLKAPADPFSVIAAENFTYTDDSVEAEEGDTVFFRGRNGYFGAWTIVEIEGQVEATLSGVWYFNSGGGGDFTLPVISANQLIVDEPSC